MRLDKTTKVSLRLIVAALLSLTMIGGSSAAASGAPPGVGSCGVVPIEYEQFLDVGAGRRTLVTAWMSEQMWSVNHRRVAELVRWADRSTVSRSPLSSSAVGLFGTTSPGTVGVNPAGWGDYVLVTQRLLVWFDYTGRRDGGTPNGGGGEIRGVWPLAVDGTGLLNFSGVRNGANWAPNALLAGADGAGGQGGGLSSFITPSGRDDGRTFNTENDPNAILVRHSPVAVAEAGAGTLHNEGYLIESRGRFAAALAPPGSNPFLVGTGSTAGVIQVTTTYRVAACDPTIHVTQHIYNTASNPVGPIVQVLTATNHLGDTVADTSTATHLHLERTSPDTCVVATRAINTPVGSCITTDQDYTRLSAAFPGARPEIAFFSKPTAAVPPPIFTLRSHRGSVITNPTIRADAAAGYLSAGVVYDTHSVPGTLIPALDLETFNATYWTTQDPRLQIRDRTLPPFITAAGGSYYLAANANIDRKLNLTVR